MAKVASHEHLNTKAHSGKKKQNSTFPLRKRHNLNQDHSEHITGTLYTTKVASY